MTEDERESRGLPLMVLAALLLFLIALGYPAWRYYTASADRNATMALVQNLATAITTYPTKTLSWELATPAGPQRLTEFLWDLNHDGHLDGMPAGQFLAIEVTASEPFAATRSNVPSGSSTRAMPAGVHAISAAPQVVSTTV